MNSILLDDPALNGERVLIESREFLEGTLYYLQQTQKVVSMLPINSRASTLVEVTIYGDAGTLLLPLSPCRLSNLSLSLSPSIVAKKLSFFVRLLFLSSSGCAWAQGRLPLQSSPL